MKTKTEMVDVWDISHSPPSVIWSERNFDHKQPSPLSTFNFLLLQIVKRYEL